MTEDTPQKLSPEVINRHMPKSSAAEVLPSLWVGNLMAVSHLNNLMQQSTTPAADTKDTFKKNLVITVVSVLSNPNLIRFVTDALEQQRLQFAKKDTRIEKISIEIKHVIVHLKDTFDSDLLSILPNALTAIDEALNIDSNNGLQQICLVHCAKGASRSVSVVIAYLISRHANRFNTFDEALRHVRLMRPKATPNIGFALALRKYEKELKRSR
jgi:protein-tyrosine phosphatase